METEATTTKSKQATKKNKAKKGTGDTSDQDTDTEDSDAESADTVEITKRLRSNFKPKAVPTDSLPDSLPSKRLCSNFKPKAVVRTDSSPESSPSKNARASRSKKDMEKDAKARKVRTHQEVEYDFTFYLPLYAGCGVRAE